MSWGATIVTFLLLAGIVPGSRNCLHVIDEIHEMRSPSSVSGFMLSLTIRLPAGNFLHELNSFSPGRSPVPVAAGEVAVGDVAAGVGAGWFAKGAASMLRRPSFLGDWVMGGGGEPGGDGAGAPAAGEPAGGAPGGRPWIFVAAPSAPTTTAV